MSGSAFTRAVTSTRPAPGGAQGTLTRPLRKLLIGYCEKSVSSKGLRDYLVKNAVELARANPSVEFVLMQRPQRAPLLRGYYRTCILTDQSMATRRSTPCKTARRRRLPRASSSCWRRAVRRRKSSSATRSRACPSLRVASGASSTTIPAHCSIALSPTSVPSAELHIHITCAARTPRDAIAPWRWTRCSAAKSARARQTQNRGAQIRQMRHIPLPSSRRAARGTQLQLAVCAL